jgi:hypothetical protein
MNLLKEEKKFWQRHYKINNPDRVPATWQAITGMGFEEDDNYFYYFSLRVTTVQRIDIQESQVTDEGVKHMAGFKGLSALNLRKHPGITFRSIPYFNRMQDLESLDITKTSISLADLCQYLNNPHLKEVFLSSAPGDGNVEEKGFYLKERMPACNIYLDTSFANDVFGHPIAPIF